MYNWTGLPETINDPVAGVAGAEPVNCCKVNNTEALKIWLPVKVLLPVDANDAVIAAVTKDDVLALVTNELVTLFKLPILATLAAISVAKDELTALVAISVASDELKLAVCANTCASVAYVASNDELNASFAATLVLNDALAAVNEPDISVPIWAAPDINVFPNSASAVATLPASDELSDVEEPDISDAICAAPDIKVLPNSDSAVVNLVLIEELAAVKDPEISDAICAELDNAPTKVPEKVVDVVEPVTDKLPVNWCVSTESSPNLVLPDWFNTTDCVSSVLNIFAMIVSDTSNDPVKCTVLPDWGVMFVTFNVLILYVC